MKYICIGGIHNGQHLEKSKAESYTLQSIQGEHATFRYLKHSSLTVDQSIESFFFYYNRKRRD